LGIALWVVCALVAFLTARLVPFARDAKWTAELITAIAASCVFGAVATALDFGGWNEPDWRAGLFAFAGACASAGAVRLVKLRRQPLA
jgi:hypothetical protein